MSFQNVPAPTAPGIWSEPSKRNVSALYATSAMVRVRSFGYCDLSNDVCGEMNELVPAVSPPRVGLAMIFMTFLALSVSLSRTDRSPPPTTGFSPPALAGGKPNTPISWSALDTTSAGMKSFDTMKLPCLSSMQPGLLSHIGLSASLKAVLATEPRPPATFPLPSTFVSNQSAASFTSGESNLTSLVTHLL